MTEYINNFENTRRAELDAIAQPEAKIVELLEHSSKICNFIKNLPSAQEYKEVTEDLNFKT